MWVLPLFLFVGLAVAADWKVVNVDRTIDISSQIVKVSSQLTLSNTGSTEANTVEILVPKEESDHLAYIAAQEGTNKGKLKVSKLAAEKEGFKVYKVELLNRIAKGAEVKLKVEQRFTEILSPLPEKITQKENQFVVYNGNAHYAAAYPVAQEKTTVKIGNGKTLSATQVSPTNQENEKITYGPYKDQPAFNSKPIKIHYEN
ncbi:ribophorin I, partial [Cooperia oncophora]